VRAIINARATQNKIEIDRVGDTQGRLRFEPNVAYLDEGVEALTLIHNQIREERRRRELSAASALNHPEPER
jgi:hypothetical protein